MTKTSRLAALFCFVACFGTIAPIPLTAQTPPADAKAEKVIPELEVHNTQIRDVVAYLRHEVPDANIVLAIGVGEIRIPELQLRNVTLTQALQALPFATNGAVAVILPGGNSPGMFTIVNLHPEAKIENITRVFLLPPWPDADFDKQLAAMLDAVNHLFTLTRNTRTAAGETGTGLRPPALEAHRPTHLLLVAGTREGVELAAQVIIALQGKTVDTDPARTPDKPAKPAE